MAQPLASRSAAVEGIVSRPGRLIIGLAVLAALFPAVRRRLTRVGWTVFGAVVLFLLVASITQG